MIFEYSHLETLLENEFSYVIIKKAVDLMDELQRKDILLRLELDIFVNNNSQGGKNPYEILKQLLNKK